MDFLPKILPALFIAILFSSASALANGGDQRVVEGKYLINLSRAPFTPIAGTKTAMTVSFVDIQTGKIIPDDIRVTVRVAKGRGSSSFIHEEKDILVKGGILEWSYTFGEPGIHELFFHFAFASDPQKIYEPPDFLLDVQSAEAAEKDGAYIFIGVLSAFAGAIVGWVAARRST